MFATRVGRQTRPRPGLVGYLYSIAMLATRQNTKEGSFSTSIDRSVGDNHDLGTTLIELSNGIGESIKGVQSQFFTFVRQSAQDFGPIILDRRFERESRQDEIHRIFFGDGLSELLLKLWSKFWKTVWNIGRAVAIGRDDGKDLGNQGFCSRRRINNERHLVNFFLVLFYLI